MSNKHTQILEPNWIYQNSDLEFSADIELPEILKTLLVGREVCTEEQVHDFLSPKLSSLADPFLLPEMETAVTRILQAVDSSEEVILYGDYDVDGISSLTLLAKMLEAYGLSPKCFIPERAKEGYGLTDKGLERCLAEGKPDLLITLDCGTVSYEQLEFLGKEGIEVIVIDHHEMGEQGRPRCEALVNPKAGEEFHYLCAAGVTFKVCHALLKKRPLSDFDLKSILDIVALATVADIVPMVGENRILVSQGLRRIPQTEHVGLEELAKISSVSSTPRASDVGFRIGPRINAAGRLDRPLEALEVLRTDCRRTASWLVAKLDKYNASRQAIEREMLEEALQQIEELNAAQDSAIVLSSERWHPGVVGIVASRIMRRFHKPTFIIAVDSDGVGKGSSRSFNTLSLVNAINANKSLITGGGGHHQAAGITIPESQIDAFREAMKLHFASEYSLEDRTPQLKIDAEVKLSELHLDFLESYNLLHPFGPENPQPLFAVKEVVMSKPPQILKNDHVKLFVAQNGVEREVMYFSGASKPLPPEPWDIAFTIDRNEFRGRVNLQMTLSHLKSSNPQ